jgi:hypothetical protein
MSFAKNDEETRKIRESIPCYTFKYDDDRVYCIPEGYSIHEGHFYWRGVATWIYSEGEAWEHAIEREKEKLGKIGDTSYLLDSYTEILEQNHKLQREKQDLLTQIGRQKIMLEDVLKIRSLLQEDVERYRKELETSKNREETLLMTIREFLNIFKDSDANVSCDNDLLPQLRKAFAQLNAVVTEADDV